MAAATRAMAAASAASADSSGGGRDIGTGSGSGSGGDGDGDGNRSNELEERANQVEHDKCTEGSASRRADEGRRRPRRARGFKRLGAMDTKRKDDGVLRGSAAAAARAHRRASPRRP
eukprot:4667485-Pleurochrysis_carterae.AAC.3